MTPLSFVAVTFESSSADKTVSFLLVLAVPATIFLLFGLVIVKVRLVLEKLMT